MNSELRDSPIFICGHPKAGTSLLRGILDSHRQLVAYPEETGFFRRYLPKAQGKTPEEKLALSDQYLTHIFEWNRARPPEHQKGFPDRDYSHIPVEAVRNAQRLLVAERFQHEGDMLSAAILAYGEAAGCLSSGSRRWVEKTPYNEYYAKQIFAWWPDARCVHLVRDPRDNYLSYHRKHKDWTPQIFASSWRRSTHAGMTNQENYGSRQYLLIRYEDFIEDVEGMISELCSFLSIDDDPVMRNPSRGGNAWGGNSMFADRFESISSAPVGRWRKSMADSDRFVIERLASAPMRAMHYEFANQSRSEMPWRLRLATYKTLISIMLKEKFG